MTATIVPTVPKCGACGEEMEQLITGTEGPSAGKPAAGKQVTVTRCRHCDESGRSGILMRGSTKVYFGGGA